MAEVSRTIENRSLRFVMTTAGANTLIGDDPAPAQWAAAIKTSPPAAMSSVEPREIRTVLTYALLLGGMAWSAAVDTAELIHRSQLNRSVDYLAADLIAAVV